MAHDIHHTWRGSTGAPHSHNEASHSGPSNTPGNAAPAKTAGLMLKRSPREFLAMFLQRWWIGAIIGVAVAVPLYFLTPRPEPIYRTDVSLLFESKKNRVLNMQEVVETTLESAAELNTHMEQLRSKTFLEYLLSSFTPDEVKRIQSAYADPERPEAPLPSLAEIIQPNVYVYNRRNTTILGISVANRSPDAAALIANRYGRKYIDFNLDRGNTQTNSAIIFLRNQAEEMRAEVEATENALQAYRAKHNMASLGETKDVTLQKMSSLGNAVVQAELALIEVRSILEKISTYQRDGKDLTELPQINTAPQVAATLATLDQLRQERTSLDQRYLRRHPKIKQNQVDMEDAQSRLKASIEKAVNDLRTRFAIGEQHLEKLKSEMADAEVQVRQLDRIAVDYKFLEQDASTKRNAYTRINDRLSEAKITSQLDNTTIKIFDTAIVPGIPSSTGTTKILATSLGAGFLCLLIVPIGIGLLDNRVRSPDHVEKVLEQKLLGAVKPLPKLTDFERANAFRQQKDAGLIECWRGIYSEIELTSSLGYPKLMVVSSSIPAEGKSQICCNLSAVFAAHKRRVLLVDCDLRWPRLHSYFGQSTGPGWVEWIKLPKDVRPAVPASIERIDENLYVLPAGKHPDDPTELIDQLSQREVLEALGAQYDVVIFDTPPATIFPDALLMARCCHELIYVIRYAKVGASTAVKTLARFRETGIVPLGVILNQLPESSITSYGHYSGYGAYGSKYYKSYGRDRAAADAAA